MHSHISQLVLSWPALLLIPSRMGQGPRFRTILESAVLLRLASLPRGLRWMRLPLHPCSSEADLGPQQRGTAAKLGSFISGSTAKTSVAGLSLKEGSDVHESLGGWFWWRPKGQCDLNGAISISEARPQPLSLLPDCTSLSSDPARSWASWGSQTPAWIPTVHKNTFILGQLGNNFSWELGCTWAGNLFLFYQFVDTVLNFLLEFSQLGIKVTLVTGKFSKINLCRIQKEKQWPCPQSQTIA